MTGKERVLSVLNKEKPDRLPFVPCIDPYFQSGLAPKYKKMDKFELQALCKSDMMRGHYSHNLCHDSTVKCSSHVDKEGNITNSFETPVGTLQEFQKFSEASPYIPFPFEYLIKNIEDLKVYNYILEHSYVKPYYKEINDAIKKYPDILVSSSFEDSSFRNLLTKKIGVEQFVFFFYENQSLVEETIQKLAGINEKLLEIAVQGPAEVFISYENTNTANSSPQWIDDYEIPLLNKYAKIAHNYGKKMLIHMCGHLNLVIDKLALSEFDGIVDASPAPTGDLDFEKGVLEMQKKDKILAGGIDCNTFIQSDIKRFETEVYDLLDKTNDSPIFMLGSGDAVPCGAPLENVLKAAEIAESKKF